MDGQDIQDDLRSDFEFGARLQKNPVHPVYRCSFDFFSAAKHYGSIARCFSRSPTPGIILAALPL